MSDFLHPQELQQARLPCPSLSPRAFSNSSLVSWQCHPTISFSVTHFSSCPHYFPTSGSFPMSQLLGFTSGKEGRWSRICLQCRRSGSIPGSGRSSGQGHGNLLQYSCLENLMDRGARWATVPGVAEESDMTEQLRWHIYIYIYIFL